MTDDLAEVAGLYTLEDLNILREMGLRNGKAIGHRAGQRETAEKIAAAIRDTVMPHEMSVREEDTRYECADLAESFAGGEEETRG